MRESLTLKIVDEVLDVAGFRKSKDIQKRIDNIWGMPSNQLYELVDDLSDRINTYYKMNLALLCREMMKKEGMKAYHYGSPTPMSYKQDFPVDWFLRKASLYYDKIVLEDPIAETISQRKGLEDVSTRGYLATYLSYFASHKPWMEGGVVEIIPSPMHIQGMGDVIDGISAEDCEEEMRNLNSPYFDYGEFDMNCETVIRESEKYIDYHLKERIEGPGELRRRALRAIVKSASWVMSGAVFGSLLMDSHPTTETKRDWEILHYWITKRAEELVGNKILSRERWKEMLSQAEAGMPWLHSEIKGLGFIREMPVNKALEIRNSREFSFRTFREELGGALDSLQASKEGDREKFSDVIEHELVEVRKVAEDVKADLENLKARSRVEDITSGLSMTLSFMPLSFSDLAQTLLVDRGELGLQEGFLEKKKAEMLSAYWLVKLVEGRPDSLGNMRKSV